SARNIMENELPFAEFIEGFFNKFELNSKDLFNNALFITTNQVKNKKYVSFFRNINGKLIGDCFEIEDGVLKLIDLMFHDIFKFVFKNSPIRTRRVYFYGDNQF